MTVEKYISEDPSYNSIIESINSLFAPLEIKVDEVVKGAQSIKYKLNLPLDFVSQGKIRRNEKNIKYALSSAVGTTDFIYGKDEKSVFIEMRNKDFKVVGFNDLKAICRTNSLNLVLGKDENGKKIYTNLSKAPHILVGGTTGSGKSELLHTFIASLIVGMPYTHAELLIIDPKRAEYNAYKNRKPIRLITEVADAFDYLNQAVDLMEKRYAELERVNAKDIYRYKGDMDMHPYVIIIDELADLMQSNPEVEKPIVRIAQKARACGIHLIIGTQSPRRSVVTGLIQTNTPTKIALHTSDQIESRIVLGSSGAEKLLGKGDMLYLGNGAMSLLRVQSAYVDDNTKRNLAATLEYGVPEERVVKSEEESVSERLEKYLNGDIQERCKNEVEAYKKKYNIESSEPPKKKRVGLIGGLINLLKVKPIMFETDDYPPKL